MISARNLRRSTMKSTPTSSQISPKCIAAGIGLADRREICGLLALMEAAGSAEMVKGLVATAQEKMRLAPPPDVTPVARISSDMLAGPLPTPALRNRLWHELAAALELPDTIPLSSRRTRREAAAVAVRAAEVLKPAIIAARHAGEDVDATIAGKMGSRLLRSIPGLRSGADDACSFPDIVASEVEALMARLKDVDLDRTFDPEVAEAIRRGQVAMSAAALAGGGWLAFASAVGSAGFAPYMLAAQLSAFIPFVSGPALVSLLAVMVNPVTLIAGTAALGYWAFLGQSASTRRTVAARIAVLLSLRGMQDEEGGVAALVTGFRRCNRLSRADLKHLSRAQYDRLTNRTRRIEERLGLTLPPAAASAPGTWGQSLQSAGTHEGIVDIALVGTLTAGDMLFHVAAIDPAVLAAADFSRTLAIDDPLALAVHVADFASAGAQISLRGYTAEQLVMARLTDQGHVVTLAANSTMPGYDLIVDGHAVQIKCGANLSLLHDHFARYPDIPIIADIDLARMAEAADAPWSSLVSSVDGFDLDHVQGIMERSLDAAEALSDAGVPVFAILVGSARAASKVWSGEIPIEDLPAWLVLDLSIRGGLAATGQIGGAFVGLLVIGPAGALVLGPVIGVAALFGTGKLHGLVDRAIRGEWHDAVMAAAERLRREVMRSMTGQLDLLIERQQRVRRSGQQLPGNLMTWLDARMVDDVVAVWEDVDDLAEVMTLRDAMTLLLSASSTGIGDVEVARARRELAAMIATKPSTVDAIRSAGEMLAEAAERRLRKS
jgi:hypothetical protein